MIVFSVKDGDVKDLESKLKKIKDKAIPFAVKNTLNGLAFEARKSSISEIKQSMMLRNAWTIKSIRVDKAQSLNISRMESIVGSTADYMEKQEFGHTEVKKGESGVPLATTTASGEGKGARPRKRLPRRANQLSQINLRRGRRSPKNNKQALLFKVQDGIRTGQRKFYHDFGGGKKKGIFRVKGGTKRFKRGWPKGASIDMLYDMTETTVKIPKNPWLQPATRDAVKMRDEIYGRSLRFQLDRIK